MTSDRDESWALGCCELPGKCRTFAQAASALLGDIVSAEADRLAGEGFVVPARESLHHAAQVFENLALLQGGEHWSRRPMPAAGINMVCAVIGSVDSFEREWDLQALSSWWNWKDGQKMLNQARCLQRMVNAGQLTRVIALFEADVQRADREFGESR